MARLSLGLFTHVENAGSLERSISVTGPAFLSRRLGHFMGSVLHGAAYEGGGFTSVYLKDFEGFEGKLRWCGEW